MTPRRIQRLRARGWRAPACSCGCGRSARYVGRGTKWGNPWRIIYRGGSWQVWHGIPVSWKVPVAQRTTKEQAQAVATREYRAKAVRAAPSSLDELAGHDLMCWCPPGTPCHADVLLELANREPAS